MKFAKELEDDLVPEWRSRYLNYKLGKKKVKAVSKALREASKTPNPASADTLPFTHFDFAQRNRPASTGAAQFTNQDGDQVDPRTTLERRSTTTFAQSPPINIPGTESQYNSSDRAPLNPRAVNERRYGSFVGTPPDEPSILRPLQLPVPAMNLQNVADSGNAYRVGPPKPKHRAPGYSTLRKVFRPHEIPPQIDDVQLEAYEKLDNKQTEFYRFLDKELEKVEGFYKSKEDEATERLKLLREQLHELRDRRLNEVYQAQHNGQVIEGEDGLLREDLSHAANSLLPKKLAHNIANGNGLNPLHRGSKVGRVTKSLQENTSPPGPLAHSDVRAEEPQTQHEDRGDYVRRRDHAPSYRVAKRRLKLALQEFYRGLELLKSYTLLNRTAFRKINKKYDKALKARPTMRYYADKVENAYFVRSDVIGGHIVAVEDLYARYFEKGNHKVAIGKLRSKLKAGDQSAVAFRNGLYLAAGTCFAAAGLTTAVRRLFDADPSVAGETSYIMQLYGGYFLALLLFLLFVLDCRIWTANRINYQFVFEYDPRHTLDWRQLAELPCFFLFLEGLILFVNFQHSPDHWFYKYWFVLLVIITILIMGLPFGILYPHARRWWGYSNWRLFFAGFYPVEFRDFYLGDMYCSATYSMAQIEVFFCLYVNEWQNPAQCNSSHSRLLGFFAALPAVWRALQCLRRYRDSKNWFPHLANFAKYMGNVLYYMTLSMYRIELGWRYKLVFILFAAINGVYCSIWDIFMDWSLGDWWSSENWGLRSRLAYKSRWPYYAAIPTDIVLRQQWIFYAIFTEDVQHNTAVSFSVSLAEVLRRAMWSLFRVENEHCNNVENYRASRDIPLPYKLSRESSDEPPTPERPSQQIQHQEPAISATGADVERQATDTSSVRQRTQSQKTPTVRALQRVGTVIAAAHAQDFQKKKRPVTDAAEDDVAVQAGSSDEDEEDDEDDEMDAENVEAAGRLMRRAERASGT